MKGTTRADSRYGISKVCRRHGRNVIFHLNISSQDVLEDFAFECPQEDREWLCAFADRIVGKTLDELFTIKVDSFDIDIFLLRQILREYCMPEALETEKAGLVCRCFNVSVDEIRSCAVGLHPGDVSGVTELLRAGGGCTSCLADIKQIIADVHPKGSRGLR